MRHESGGRLEGRMDVEGREWGEVVGGWKTVWEERGTGAPRARRSWIGFRGGGGMGSWAGKGIALVYDFSWMSKDWLLCQGLRG